MQTSDFRKGNAVKYNGETWLISDFQFVNPGKGTAFTRTKLKNIKTGKALEVSFKSGESIEEADLQYRRCQYMYNDGTDYNFMDNKTYDQFTIPKDMVSEYADLMVDNSEVTLVFIDGAACSIQMPPKLDFKVIAAPPGEKGDTATGGTKPVTIETGATVNVPLFIKEGDTIRINTETHAYVERVQQK
jgi:elongation factor P